MSVSETFTVWVSEGDLCEECGALLGYFGECPDCGWGELDDAYWDEEDDNLTDFGDYDE